MLGQGSQKKGMVKREEPEKVLGKNHFCGRERPLGRKVVHDEGKEKTN